MILWFRRNISMAIEGLVEVLVRIPVDLVSSFFGWIAELFSSIEFGSGYDSGSDGGDSGWSD